MSCSDFEFVLNLAPSIGVTVEKTGTMRDHSGEPPVVGPVRAGGGRVSKVLLRGAAPRGRLSRRWACGLPVVPAPAGPRPASRCLQVQ